MSTHSPPEPVTVGSRSRRTWPAPRKESASEFAQLAGIHVMVVDDNPDAREILQSALQYCGALVTTLDSAVVALKLLREVRPDVIVTDLAMPRNNGLWLMREILALRPDRGGQIPVLAVSAHDDAYDRRRVLDAGFREYLVKPVAIRELSRVVAQLVARASTT